MGTEQGGQLPRLLLFALTCLALGGCGARIKSYAGPAPGAGASLSDTVCVVVPPDGTDGKTLYRGSGNVVATHVLGVVRRTWPSATLIEPKPLSQAQPVAAQAGCTYAIVPLINTWEDRPYW